MLRNNVLSELGKLYTRKLKEEQDAEELAALRKKDEVQVLRERAEKIEREVEERIAKETKDKEDAQIADDLKRATDREHVSKIRTESKECLMEQCNIDESTAKKIILAIDADAIKNLKITY
jgi:hypothetical protein